jgi:hypothetical protein
VRSVLENVALLFTVLQIIRNPIVFTSAIVWENHFILIFPCYNVKPMINVNAFDIMKRDNGIYSTSNAIKMAVIFSSPEI